MPDAAFFGIAAGILSLAAFARYIFATLKQGKRPNRASWFIWVVVGFMLASSYYASGASHTIWVPMSYIIGPLVIALLSIKYGEGGWSRFDRNCLIAAGVSVVLWLAFRTPIVALLINLAIDMIGLLPTIHKTYMNPKSEDRSAWTLFFIGNVANLFAIETWSFAIILYPSVMFLGTGAMVVFTWRKLHAPLAAG